MENTASVKTHGFVLETMENWYIMAIATTTNTAFSIAYNALAASNITMFFYFYILLLHRLHLQLWIMYSWVKIYEAQDRLTNWVYQRPTTGDAGHLSNLTF